MIRLNKLIGLLLSILIATLFFIHLHYDNRLDGPIVFDDRDAPKEEKFLTYLPHSGLHNQRIALINSVLLAKALNRTLIMPELNLGTATYWRPSSHLPYRLDACGDKPKGSGGPNCFDYRNYLPMAVETIFDLTAVHKLGVKTIQRRDMRLDYFERYWSIPRDERNRTLVLQIPDTVRYSYQITDTPPINSTKFVEHYTLQQLADHKEPFLIFNSLFGSDRLAIHTPWSHTREWLRQEIGVRQPFVIKSSLDIIGRLGGPGAYLSVHIRMGDGIFKKMMDETMERVRQQLMDRHNTDNLPKDTMTRIRSLEPERRLAECLQLHTLHPQLGLIYMTTDAPQPHTTLPHLFDEFVCLFTLDDFADIVNSTLALRPLLLDHTNHHPTTHGSIFMPLIDAEIAAQAAFFIPTPKSTFSGYIRYRNKRFRQLYMQNTTTSSLIT